MKKVVFVALALLVFIVTSCGSSNYGRKCDGRKGVKTRMGNM